MAVQKQIRFLYQAKNNQTGLTDVKAQIYVNGVAKAVAGAAIVGVAVDATNSPGIYEIILPAASLTTWGVAEGTYSAIEAVVDSATSPAKAVFREEATVSNTDDIDTRIGAPVGASISADIAAVQTKLGTPAGATVSADVAAVKVDTAAIKADLETGAASLSTILSNILAIQNGVIGNGVGYVLPNMIIPATGSNTYKIPITINNNDGALVDPTSNVITVGLLNSAGTDRGAFLTGSSGSPATVAATRTGVGQYNVIVVIPSTATEEDLLFSFAYTIGANAMVRYGQTQTFTDLNAAGFALQSTLLTTQTAVNAIKADVEDATNGLAAIKTQGATISTNVSSVLSTVNSGTFGNSALQVQGAATQGSGFTAGTDDLHSLSTYLRANIYVGGRAV